MSAGVGTCGPLTQHSIQAQRMHSHHPLSPRLPEVRAASHGPALPDHGDAVVMLDLLWRAEAALRNYSAYIVQLILRALPRPLTAMSRVLDFGCGVGTIGAMLMDRTKLRLDGVESDAAIRAHIRDKGFNVYASLAEVNELYDVVLCVNVLEHIEDDRAALRQLHHVLKDDGVLVLYVPAFRILWSTMDDLAGHYRRYTRSALERTVIECGFRIHASRYCDAAGFFASLLYRLVARTERPPSLQALRLYDRVGVPVTRLLDAVLHGCFGKNVLVCAKKDAK